MRKNALISVLSVVLVMAMILVTPLQGFAATKKKYVSDIQVAYGDSLAAAKAKLEDAGYTAMDYNVNNGNNGKNGSCCAIGIKTTRTKSEAITDVAIMEMDGGYSYEDYENVINSYKEKADQLVDELMTAIEGYREALKEEKPAAVLAKMLLNKFTDEDFGENMLLGDILEDESTTREQLSTIFMEATTLAVSTIESCLSLAVSSDWLNVWLSTDDSVINGLTDAEKVALGEKAQKLAEAVEPFQESLREYERIFTASGLVDDAASTADDWTNYYATLTDEEQQNVNYFGGLYDYLKATKYKTGTLYDFFVAKDIKDYDTSDFMTLAYCMSDAQTATVPYATFATAFKNAISSESTWLENAVALPADTEYSETDTANAKTMLSSLADFQTEVKKYETIVTNSKLENTYGADWDAYVDTLSTEDQAVAATYSSLYGYLKDTSYKSATLYDFFMGTDAASFNADDLLPFVHSLSQAQVDEIADMGLATILANGISVFITSADSMKGDSTETTSIYDGVDRTIFSNDGSIALTDAAKKKVTSECDTSWYHGNLSEKAETALLSIIGVTGAVGAIGAVMWGVASHMTAAIYTSAYTQAFSAIGFVSDEAMMAAGFVKEVTSGVLNASGEVVEQTIAQASTNILETGGIQSAQAAATSAVANSSWSAVLAVSKIVTAISIVICIVTVILYLVEEYKAYNEDETYTEIPRILVNTVKKSDNTNKYVYYYAVKDTDGAFADLNCWKGFRWNALYYTKDTDAGEPIYADYQFTTTGTATDTSYNRPVHDFFSTAAYNMNKYAKTTTSGIYLFFKSAASSTLTGTTVSYGSYALSGAIGLVIGAAGMFAVAKSKTKKKKDEPAAESQEA